MFGSSSNFYEKHVQLLDKQTVCTSCRIHNIIHKTNNPTPLQEKITPPPGNSADSSPKFPKQRSLHANFLKTLGFAVFVSNKCRLRPRRNRRNEPAMQGLLFVVEPKGISIRAKTATGNLLANGERLDRHYAKKLS